MAPRAVPSGPFRMPWPQDADVNRGEPLVARAHFDRTDVDSSPLVADGLHGSRSTWGVWDGGEVLQ